MDQWHDMHFFFLIKVFSSNFHIIQKGETHMTKPPPPNTRHRHTFTMHTTNIFKLPCCLLPFPQQKLRKAARYYKMSQ